MKRTWLWIGAALVALAFLYLPTLGISGGQILVFLLVLLCPLMHLLGMHRHGGHGSGDSGAPGPSVPDARQVRAPDPEA
jgi:hypothetical protein